MTNALLHLLSPFSVAEFAADYYAIKPLFISGNPEKGKELFSWEALNLLLGSAPLPGLDLRVVRHGAFVHVPDHIALARECRAGATLIVDNIHERDPAIGCLAATLSSELGERVSVNLYYSQPGVQGFDCHYDTHDVFVLHLQGSKGWRIYESPVPYPLADQRVHPTIAPRNKILDISLQCGDLLYIPRGYWHEATAQEEPSIHLTIGVHVRTAVDFMTWVIDELRDINEWRRPFPLVLQSSDLDASVPESHLGHVRTIRDILNTKLLDPNLLSRFREFCVAQDKPVRILSLPTMLQNRPLIGRDTTFRRHSYQRAVIKRLAPSRFEVIVWGRIFEVARCREELLRFIFSEHSFSVADLLAVAPDMDFAGVKEIVRAFLVEGIIELAS